jgi:hypothetical protein
MMRRLILTALVALAAVPPAGADDTTPRRQPDTVVRPSPPAPRHLPGFELIRSPDGYYWWRKLAGSDGMGQPAWGYYARQLRPSASEPPLAVVLPDQVVSYNGGLNLEVMARGPQAPGFSTGGPPAASPREPETGAAGQDCDPDATPAPAPEPAPDATPERRPGGGFEAWLRAFVGIDLVTFYVVVGLFAFALFGAFGLIGLLILFLLFKR